MDMLLLDTMQTLMKTTKAVLGIIAITIACLATRTHSMAEMFYGPTSTTNRFLIGTNEAVVIDTIVYDFSWGPMGGSATVNTSNGTYLATFDAADQARFSSAPFAFAGPSELSFTNAVAIRFTRLANSSIQMLLWDGVNTNVSVAVPKGKTIQLFYNTHGSWYYYAALLAGNLLLPGADLFPGQRLEGPLTIQFLVAPPGQPSVIGAYWFIEDVFKNPNGGLVVGQGAPTIVIERSGDLTNWQSVGAFGVGLGSNTFYRLSIGK